MILCTRSLQQKPEAYKILTYCVKCRAKRERKDAKAITMKNGKPTTQFERKTALSTVRE